MFFHIMNGLDESIAIVLDEGHPAPKLRFEHNPRLLEQQKVEKIRQHRIACWCLPVVVSSFLLILLFAAASFLTHNDCTQFNVVPLNDNLIENVVSAHSLPVPIESRTMDNESFALAPFLAPFVAPIAAVDINPQDHWIQAVLTPIVMEVGVIALVQSLPLFKLIWTFQKASQGGAVWVRLATSFRQAFLRRRPAALLFRQARRSSSLSSSRRVVQLVRRAVDSIKRIYKRRSRLSAASDITHVMGDDSDQETNTRGNNCTVQNQ